MKKMIIYVVIMIFAILSVSSFSIEKVLKYGELNKPRYWWPYFDDSPVALRTMDLYFESLIEDYSHAQKIYADPPMIYPRLISGDIKIDFETNPQMQLKMSKYDYKWSNGTSITPEDIRFTLMEILGDRNHPTIFNYIADTVSDVSYFGNNVYINFYFPSKYMLSSLEVYIIPAAFSTKYNYWSYRTKSIDELKNWCSGPYIPVKEEDNLVEFDANPYYPLALNISKVEMHVERDVKTLVEKFIAGGSSKGVKNQKDRLDMIFEIPSSEYADRIMRMGTVRILPSLENRFYYITLNYRKEIFRNEEFRRLLIQSINRRLILSDVFLDRGQLITGPFLPTFQWIDTSIKPWEFSEKAQRELFEKYGKKLANKTWKFIFPRGREEIAKVAFVIADELMNETGLSKLGFRIKIENLGPEDYYNALQKGDFDLAFTEYAAMKTFVSLKPLFDENGSQNYGKFNSISTLSYDKELTDLINKVEGVEAFKLDDLEREKIYKMIHKLSHDKEYQLWLFAVERQTFMYNYVMAPYIDPSRPFKNIDEWDIKY